MAELTFTDLWEILNYDFVTGRLFWRERPLKYFPHVKEWKRWNKRYANKEIWKLSSDKKYLNVNFLNKNYKTHRVIWCMCFGEWPKGEIDHIDGDTFNNRITNLRDVTIRTNRKNRTIETRNKSGVTGVYQRKQDKKWIAAINTDSGKTILGYYTDFNEAVLVRKAAEIIFGYHPNHGREKSLPTERSGSTSRAVDDHLFGKGAIVSDHVCPRRSVRCELDETCA